MGKQRLTTLPNGLRIELQSTWRPHRSVSSNGLAYVKRMDATYETWLRGKKAAQFWKLPIPPMQDVPRY